MDYGQSSSKLPTAFAYRFTSRILLYARLSPRRRIRHDQKSVLNFSVKLFANENIPKDSITVLRDAGYDVLAAGETMRGAPDTTILERAFDEHRILITFDRDYGELIFHKQMACPLAVIYLRFIPDNSNEPAERIIQLLNTTTCEGNFIVLERDNLRKRQLPTRQ
jgi:predicted nuclease of predicted toxin-antitoxin system